MLPVHPARSLCAARALLCQLAGLTVLSMALSACAITADTFPDRAAETVCKAHKACDLEDFFTNWDDGTLQCREEESSRIGSQRFGNTVDNRPNEDVVCQFDEAAAEAALQTLRDADCDDTLDRSWVISQTDVWDCVTINGT